MLPQISLTNCITKNLNLTKFCRVRILIFLFLFFSVLRISCQSFEIYADENIIIVNEQNDVPLTMGLSTYKFARIPYNGKSIDIKIKATDFEFENNDWSISPKRYNINGIKSGNVLSFKINRLGYVVIRFKQD